MNDIDASDLIDRLLNENKSLTLRLVLAEQRQAQAEAKLAHVPETE